MLKNILTFMFLVGIPIFSSPFNPQSPYIGEQAGVQMYCVVHPAYISLNQEPIMLVPCQIDPSQIQVVIPCVNGTYPAQTNHQTQPKENSYGNRLDANNGRKIINRRLKPNKEDKPNTNNLANTKENEVDSKTIPLEEGLIPIGKDGNQKLTLNGINFQFHKDAKMHLLKRKTKKVILFKQCGALSKWAEVVLDKTSEYFQVKPLEDIKNIDENNQSIILFLNELNKLEKKDYRINSSEDGYYNKLFKEIYQQIHLGSVFDLGINKDIKKRLINGINNLIYIKQDLVDEELEKHPISKNLKLCELSEDIDQLDAILEKLT